MELTPKPGQRFTVRDTGAYHPPRGLTEGQEVEMISRDNFPYLLVRADDGTEYSLPFQCANKETIYFVDGKWRREQHPLVIAEFRRRIAELEATRDNWNSALVRDNEEYLAKIRAAVAEAERLPSSDKPSTG